MAWSQEPAKCLVSENACLPDLSPAQQHLAEDSQVQRIGKKPGVSHGAIRSPGLVVRNSAGRL
jgi:hypothetical protein